MSREMLHHIFLAWLDFLSAKIPNDPDSAAEKGEIYKSEKELLIAERRKQEEEKTKELQEKNRRRWKYARNFQVVSVISLIYVAVIIPLDTYVFNNSKIENSVLIAMLGTALLTVLAPVYLLAKYLFKNNEKNNNFPNTAFPSDI